MPVNYSQQHSDVVYLSFIELHCLNLLIVFQDYFELFLSHNMLVALPSLATSADLVRIFVPSLSPSVLEISNGSRPGLPSADTAFQFGSKPLEMTPGVCFFQRSLPHHSCTCSCFHSLSMATPMGQSWTPLKDPQDLLFFH